jgi:hypothetical protein
VAGRVEDDIVLEKVDVVAHVGLETKDVPVVFVVV